MRIIKVQVDFLFADETEFVGRYLYETYRGTVVESDGPVYGKILDSGSVQLYDIDGGSIRKAGRTVVKADKVDFTHAFLQASLPKVEA